MKHPFILILLFALCWSPLMAQQNQDQDLDIQVTYAEYLGKTPPLRHLVPVPNTDPEKRKIVKDNKKTIPNFLGRGKYRPTNKNGLPQGPDPLWQKEINRSAGIVVDPLVNVSGLASGANPPDPSGDIGADHYVQAINATTVGVYDKDGNFLNSFSANTIWTQVGFTSAGDPIILYDQEEDRWLITEFPSGNQLLVAISDDSDPMGSWTAYNFGTPSFPDYPKYGIWSNAYSVTTNEQGPGTLPCYFIDRQSMLNGDAMVPIIRITLPGIGSGPGFQVATPVDWSGLTPPVDDMPIILTMVDDGWGPPQDQVRVHAFDLDFGTPSNSTVTTTNVDVSAFDSNPCSVPGFGFSCVPQGGNGGGLDGLPEVIMNQPHYRNFGSYESMIMAFITDVSGGNDLSGIRWIEMRRSGGNDWEVHQEGTYAPNDGLDRYMPTIAMDGDGNIGLAYAASSEDEFVGLRFTGRRASDPPGEMCVEEYTLVTGTNTINSFARFGDYFHLSIDPTNDRTFWGTAEYAGGGGHATRVFAFEIGRDTTDIGPITLLTPQDADDLTATEVVQIEVQNFGLDTPTVFDVGYIFDGGTPVFETINFTLLPDSIYTHTFATTVDMSAVGDYDFDIFTSLMDDEAPLNDTLRVVVSKLPRWDAGITAIDGLDGVVCGDSAQASVQLTNFGTETLTSVTIEVELNGMLIQTINWMGNLAMGESATLNISLPGLIDGVNEVIVSTSEPNGMTDEVPVNDAFTRNFDVIADGEAVFLRLFTDDYPEETTWTLSDQGGNVLYSGGPYNMEQYLHIVEFCLDPDECYIFTINDAAGDGICCQYGPGYYEILDDFGNELAAGDGTFGFTETMDFCATFMCTLEADIEVSPETEDGADDGMIMITPIGGIGPFMYSIDGGQTFQSGNTFFGLGADDYDVVIMGDFDCLYEETITVPLCALSLMVTVTNESGTGAADGQIEIVVSNGSGNYQYSIDGGQTFQSGNIFTNLGADDYNIVVRDDDGCAATEIVSVGTISSLNPTVYGYTIELFPNPTDGFFQINVKGIQQRSPFLAWEIYSMDGKLVQTGKLVKYNDTFTGPVSLVSYPGGVYFVRFVDRQIDELIRVVKQ